MHYTGTETQRGFRLLGGPVRGGPVYGRQPALSEGQPDEGGNFALTTDFS